MAEPKVDAPVATPVTTSPIVEKKSGSKTVWIVLAIVAALLLCCCTVVAIFFFVLPKFAGNGDSQYYTYLDEYGKYVDEVNDNWVGSDDKCDKTEKIDAIYEDTYTIDEIEPIYTTLPALLDEEWACYLDYHNFELNKDKTFNTKFKDFDCSKVTDKDNCSKFKTALTEIIRIQEDIIDTNEKAYDNNKTVGLCYFHSLEDNYDDTTAKDTADSLCEAQDIKYSDEIDALDEEYDAQADILDDIVALPRVTTTP